MSRQSRRRDPPSTSRPVTPMGMADQPLSPAPPATSMENKPPPQLLLKETPLGK